jgi:hypothetical protein
LTYSEPKTFSLIIFYIIILILVYACMDISGKSRRKETTGKTKT